MKILLINPNISQSVSDLIASEAISSDTLWEILGLISRMRMVHS